LIKLLNHLTVGMSLPLRMFRFACVGLLSSLAYVLAVAFYVEILAIGAKFSSATAYITVLPASYLGHRKLTFRSINRPSSEINRFLALHLVNILISVLGMYGIVDWLGYSYWLGSLLAAILVPISTFLLMNHWIFVRRNG